MAAITNTTILWLSSLSLSFVILGLWIRHLRLRLKEQKAQFAILRDTSEKLAQSNMQLQNQQQESQFLAQANERLRIAREIHDTVGHSLNSVIYQLSALEAIASVEAPQFCSKIEKNTQLCRNTLNEVRLEVSNLRNTAENGPSWHYRMLNLCENYQNAIGMEIDITLGKLDGVSEELGTTLCRILQECLTNAYRHGKASKANFVFVEKYEPKHMLLFYFGDNGCGTNKLTVGNGLRGIRERVRKLGGQMAWQSEAGKGFDLGIDIPVKPSAGIEP